MNTVQLIHARPAAFEESISDAMKKLQSSLPNINIKLNDELEYPEYIFNEKLDRVCVKGAKYCCGNLNQNVITTRTGISISALNDFPGFATRYVIKTIGIEGLLTLLKEQKDRSIQWFFYLAFCKPGSEPKLFKGIVNGQIPIMPRGKGGYAFDTILIPNGYNQTFAENPDLKNKLSARNLAINKFSKWYTKNL